MGVGSRVARVRDRRAAFWRTRNLKWVLAGGVAAVTLVIDLVTKRVAESRLALGELHEVLPFLYLQRTRNDGVAFGLMGGRTALIVAASVLAILVVALYIFLEKRVLLAGLAGGAVLGGSLGNLVQRVTGDGHVTDFLKFPHWPNFNLADVFLDAGIAAIFIGIMFELFRSRKTHDGARPSNVGSDDRA